MFAYVKAVSKMHKIACPKFTKWLRCVKFRIVGANNGAGLLIFIVICDIMKIIMAETRPLIKIIDDKILFGIHSNRKDLEKSVWRS